jgi:hypothetical protein
MTKEANTNTYLTPQFDNLIERQKAWNEGSRRISKQELYAVLAGCLSLVETVKQNSMYSQLEKELKARGLSFNSSTGVPTRVVRCVFNTDERALSSFASAIAIANRRGIESGDFVKWVNEHGGIDKVRRKFAKAKKSKEISVSELLSVAKNNLHAMPTLAVISKANIVNVKSTPASGFVINISRINPNGDYEVVATSTDSTAIRSALANWGQYVTDNNLTVSQTEQIKDSMSALNAALAA